MTYLIPRSVKICYHNIVIGIVIQKLVVASNELIVKNGYLEQTLVYYFILLLLNFWFIGSKHI